MLLLLRLALLGGPFLGCFLRGHFRLQLREARSEIFRLVAKTFDLVAERTELDLACGPEVSKRLADAPSQASCVLALEASRERSTGLRIAEHLERAHRG